MTGHITLERIAGAMLSARATLKFGFLAAGEALRKVYTHLKQHGSSVGGDVPLCKFSAFSELMGFGAVSEFDKTYGRK